MIIINKKLLTLNQILMKIMILIKPQAIFLSKQLFENSIQNNIQNLLL